MVADSNTPLLNTTCIHGHAFKKAYGPVTLPLSKSTTFAFSSIKDIERFYSGELPFEYGRYRSPTVNACEERYAAIEGAESAALFGSGMAAFTTTLLTFLRAGDHVVIGDDSYRRLRTFCTETLARYGVTASVVPMGSVEGIAASLRQETKLIILEAPTNPYLRITDLAAVATLAKERGILSLIDATLATPYNLRPLEHGIDLVLHSATKYLGGHNDLLAGVVAGSKILIDKILEERHQFGTIIDPDAAWRLERSLKTLPLRMQQHNESALAVANLLQASNQVAAIWYPHHASHPDYDTAKRYLRGGGGVVSFTIKGGTKECCALIDSLRIAKLADSLGGTETIVKPVALLSFYRYTPEERALWGIPDNLIRLAVGLEDTEVILDDLDQALNKLSRSRLTLIPSSLKPLSLSA
jgi:cystathionine gamma-synthase